MSRPSQKPQFNTAMNTADIISKIVHHNTRAKDYMKSRVANINRMKAIITRGVIADFVTAGDDITKLKPKTPKVKKEVKKRYKAVVSEYKEHGPVPQSSLHAQLMPYLDGAKAFQKIENVENSYTEALAVKLPGYATFVKPLRGFGELSFGRIVGEARNIGAYPTITCLWKRLGLATIGENRQGHVPKDMPKAERNTVWIEHGYSPWRRSVVWNAVDQPLIGKRIKETKYHALYTQQVMLYHDKFIVDGKHTGPSHALAHARKCAARFVAKRILLDLWIQWRIDEGIDAVGRRGAPELPTEVREIPVYAKAKDGEEEEGDDDAEEIEKPAKKAKKVKAGEITLSAAALKRARKVA